MQEYRFKFYLNALHYIVINDKNGDIHPHTWEIIVDIFKQGSDFIEFSDVEKPIENILKPMQNKNINSIPPFDTINPTLENITKYLYSKFEPIFVSNGFIMSRIEVSETPSRSFIIDITNSEFPYRTYPTTDISMDIVNKEVEKLIDKKIEKTTERDIEILVSQDPLE